MLRSLFLLPILFAADAYALTTLKKIQITDGARVDLFFDAKVAPAQIRTEFANDIIQLSLENVSIYPAKITSIAGADLTKVFAYQYTPKLVRARFTVKGKAEAYKDRLSIENGGKVLTLKIAPGSSDQVVTSASQAIRAEAPPKVDPEQKVLLEKVMNGTPARAEAAPEKTEKSEKADAPVTKSRSTHSPLTTGKPLPSPWRSLAMLGAVLTLFAGLAFVLRKLPQRTQRNGATQAAGAIRRHKGFGGLLNRLGVGPSSKMIEVVSTHHLGPKKSISVVRVSGRTLVLGVTNDSINLITQLNGRAEASSVATSAPKSDVELFDLFGEELARESDMSPEPPRAEPTVSSPSPLPNSSGDTSAFAALLERPARPAANAYSASAASSPSAVSGATTRSAPVNPAANPPLTNRPSSRAQIRSRLEGLKQL